MFFRYIKIMLMFLLSSCSADGAWDLMRTQSDISRELTGWKNRIKINIDNSAQSETLTDFPVLVKLNSTNITYSNIKSDGSDLSFYSKNFDEKLEYEIDTWNPSGDSYIWVKIPSIPGGSNSSYFWLYYSSDINSGVENSAAVWSSDYRGVWHLAENGTSYSDSSPYSNNGTGGSSTVNHTDPISADAVIGKGQDLRAAWDSIMIPENSSINTLAPFSISFWVKNVTDTGDRLFSKNQLQLWVSGPSPRTNIRLEIDYSGGLLERECDCIPLGVWKYLTITWDGSLDASKILFYGDGELLTPGNSNTPTGSRTPDDSTDFFIGNAAFYGASNSRDCLLDEFRISGSIRSADWIKAQYLSQTGSFLTYGPEESL